MAPAVSTGNGLSAMPARAGAASEKDIMAARVERISHVFIGDLLRVGSCDQFAAFCFSFAMIVSCQVVDGGMLMLSPTNAVQMSFLDVERMRAEPVPGPQNPTMEFTPWSPRTSFAGWRVPNLTV